METEEPRAGRSWIIPVVVVFALALLVIIALVGDDDSAIEVLRIFLGWPVIVAALLLAFAVAFREEFKTFLKNVGTIRFPGGEIQMQQQQLSVPVEEPPPTDESEEHGAGTAEQLHQEVDSLQRMSLYWFLRYLDVYLVPHTKLVLAWLSSASDPITDDALWKQWGTVIPNPPEQAAVLKALLDNDLIEWSGGNLRITERGRRYLMYMAGRVSEATAPIPPAGE